MSQDVIAPSLGESVSEIIIGEWRKSVGDRVELDEPLVELESEKATIDLAAPVAGVIKSILALRHGEIPPHLHFRQLNPSISFDGLPVVIPTAPVPWPRTDAPRIAGVSSFGFGGTNAHAVLAEPPGQVGDRSAAPEPADVPCILPISARSEEALVATAAQLAGYLDDHPDVTLPALAYTLGRRRAHLSHRQGRRDA